MGLADELLAIALADDGEESVVTAEEEHIVITDTRQIVVPDSLRVLAVVNDKEVETVTFDCVRYWDDNDLSQFAIYLNYILPDGTTGTYIPEQITPDGDVYHFDWLIKSNITKTSGKISFGVTAIKTATNSAGESVVDKQWSSFINSDCSIAAGVGVSIVPDDSDDSGLIAQLTNILKNVPVRGEWLRGESIFTGNRSIDDLTSFDDVGFYVGDGYSLIVSAGSFYGNYDTIHQIKIANATPDTLNPTYVPTVYVRQYFCAGSANEGTWTEWATFGSESSGEVDEEVDQRLSALEQSLADLTYTAISITSFSANPSILELGDKVTNVTLSWRLNKVPSTLILDGVSIDTSATTAVKVDNFKSDTSWSLQATDERGAISTKYANLNFVNGVYYGVSGETSTYDSAFVLGLTKTLRNSKLTSFSANAADGQYIYYCVPTRFGTCSFKVGGFDGGFSLVTEIVFANSLGYSEHYYIYRSDNAGLGQTSVSVS